MDEQEVEVVGVPAVVDTQPDTVGVTAVAEDLPVYVPDDYVGHIVEHRSFGRPDASRPVIVTTIQGE